MLTILTVFEQNVCIKIKLSERKKDSHINGETHKVLKKREDWRQVL